MDKNSNQKSKENTKSKSQVKSQSQKSSTEFAKELCPKEKNENKCK